MRDPMLASARDDPQGLKRPVLGFSVYYVTTDGKESQWSGWYLRQSEGLYAKRSGTGDKKKTLYCYAVPDGNHKGKW